MVKADLEKKVFLKQIEGLNKEKMDLQKTLQDKDADLKTKDLRIQQLVHQNKEKQSELDKVAG